MKKDTKWRQFWLFIARVEVRHLISNYLTETDSGTPPDESETATCLNVVSPNCALSFWTSFCFYGTRESVATPRVWIWWIWDENATSPVAKKDSVQICGYHSPIRVNPQWAWDEVGQFCTYDVIGWQTADADVIYIYIHILSLL